MKRTIPLLLAATAAVIMTVSSCSGTEAKVSRKDIKAHDRALHIKDGWIRDPFIVLGPDGWYYLTGTTPNPGDEREQSDFYNTGLGGTSIVGSHLRIWRSRDLARWEYMGEPYSIEDSPNHSKKHKAQVLWAPEMQWAGDRWAIVHCPGHHSSLLLSRSADLSDGFTFPSPESFRKMHDPSLFMDDDGTWYLSQGYHGFTISKILPDFGGIDGEPVTVDPSDRTIGHEGTLIRKIGGKYVFFGTAWSTDTGRHGTYNLYYCTADSVMGPYSERRFCGRFLGHGTPFQDKDGNWWCTAFYNANVPPVDADAIGGMDVSDNAYTINPMGTTIVPLEVTVAEDGDVFIRATDPHYRNPGAEEVQKFEILK